ncbi:MAG: right-handed parallel beta-helix repeat-containing protein [candidate division KSB1 bacterium]|nr:right-handed parallel beta-helix repeat-containing protein [candidate division KSB1 bacterium]MDZ7335853.1 right-handed parallel beta-helix repeat-containing protein [candidate division KSB1 bacterium]
MKITLSSILLIPIFFLSLYADERNSRDISKIGVKTEPVNGEIYEKIYYVSIQSGSDKTGDGSKANPWQSPTFALSIINDASESNKYAIFVAEGIYNSGTIVMKEWVDLYGGFDPKNWQRDIFKYRTILDGERVRRVVVGSNNARLDGFVIQHGLSRTHGGGILCDDTSPIISNNFILDNFVLEPEDFNHNRIHQAGHHGGGIASLYNAMPVIRNNVIANNKTSVGNGGGIAFYGWLRLSGGAEKTIKGNRLEIGVLQPIVENNVIIGNSAGVNDWNRTRSSNGGGISCAYESRPIICNNIIVNNQAKGRGDGGGIYNEYYSDPLIEANWVVGNIADDDAGGIYTMRMGQPLIQHNFIAGNWAPEKGVGGIRLSKEGRARIIENMIVRNLSGGGIQCVDSFMELEKNIIMHNQGGEAVMFENRFSYFMPIIIRNNILRDNEQGSILIKKNDGQPPIIQDNNMQGGLEGEGNYDRKPEFVEDMITGKIISADFDPRHFLTTFVLQKPIDKNDQVAGRVIRLGDRWSIINNADKKSISVWGDLRDLKDQEFEIISEYRLK